MVDSHQLPLTTTVQQWLQETGGDTIRVPNTNYDDTDSLSSTTLTRRLYDACAVRLSQLCEGVSASKNCSRKARKAATEVDTQFLLFGRCFEHGKLEACLDDEELLQYVLKCLVSVGTSLLSGISSPLFIKH